MRQFKALFASFLIAFAGFSTSFADVVTSEEIMATEQQQFDRQQVLALVDSAEVQEKLIALGVDTADAKSRIAAMTDSEIVSLNSQLEELPAAGGIAGTVLTVLIVLVVLDLLGVTDVFSFIDPIT